MAILSFLITEPTGIVGDLPRRGKILSSDSYATVTAAGYLNGLNTQGQPVNTNDVFDVVYNYTSANSPGTYVQLIASVTAGVVTLAAAGGDVILPVVNGDFAVFSGTMGAIADSGLSASAASQVYVVTSPGGLTTGQLAEFKDANGTLENSGLLVSNAMSKAAVNTMAAGSEIILDKAPATSTAGAATVNKQAGVITTEILSTAAASAYAFTLTNSEIATTSIVSLQLMGGTNTTRGLELRAIPGSGTCAISIFNNNVAGTALNGTLIFGFIVV